MAPLVPNLTHLVNDQVFHAGRLSQMNVTNHALGVLKVLPSLSSPCSLEEFTLTILPNQMGIALPVLNARPLLLYGLTQRRRVVGGTSTRDKLHSKVLPASGNQCINHNVTYSI